jgi:hypothetical protein
MSFTCGVCGKTAPTGTRCTLIPVKKKEIQHPYRGGAHKAKREDGKWEFFPDEGGRGIQTAKEVKACINCAPSALAAAGTA